MLSSLRDEYRENGRVMRRAGFLGERGEGQRITDDRIFEVLIRDVIRIKSGIGDA